MKNVATSSSNNLTILFTLIVLLIVGSDSVFGGDACPCGTSLVKFEWNDSEGKFIPEGGNSHGISITNVITKPGEPNDPISVSWVSSEWYICSVIIKYGLIYSTQIFNPHVASGTSITPDEHAISHLEFCADIPLPVEMTSFSVSLNNNLAQLEWETATEVNNYGFEIQRSSENEEWNKVGFVEGHGNSNSPKNYSFIDNSLTVSGEYLFRLKQLDINGSYEYSEIVNINLSSPENYMLFQNYPNPFNPSTKISYSIPSDGFVSLNIYDVLGNEVAKIENAYKAAGNYSHSFDATHLSNGIYFYTLKTGNFIETKKMLLIK